MATKANSKPALPKGQRVQLGVAWTTNKGDISIDMDAISLQGFTTKVLATDVKPSFYATLFTNTKKAEGSKQPDYHLVAFVNGDDS